MSKNKVPDRRITRTKKAIYQALASLLKENKLENITVTELSARADINRKTFYTYYGSPVDVVNECLDDLSATMNSTMQELANELNVLSPNVMFQLLRPMIAENPILSAMIVSPNGDHLYKKLILILRGIIIENLDMSEMFSQITDPQREVIAGFIASGMITVYYSWIENPSLSFDELTGTLSQLIISGISSL